LRIVYKLYVFVVCILVWGYLLNPRGYLNFQLQSEQFRAVLWRKCSSGSR